MLMHLALMATLQNKPLVHDDLMRRFMLEGGKAAASSACDLKTRSEKPLCLQIMSKAVEFYESAYRRAAYSPPDYTCAAYHASAVISEGDLLRLIQSKTPDSTIISLVRVNGVGFTLTPLLERRFIAAGASEEVLAAIKAADRPDPGQVRVPPLEH